jgi:hypothetical protein
MRVYSCCHLRLRLLVVTAAIAASAGTWAAAPCPPTTVSAAAAEAEKKAMLGVIQGMQDTWNRGDFRGYMAGFKNPDVIFVSGGRFQNGWQGTLDHYIRDYGSSPDARGTLRFYDITIEILSPDAAQLISHYTGLQNRLPLRCTCPAGSSTSISVMGSFSSAMVRQRCQPGAIYASGRPLAE